MVTLPKSKHRNFPAKFGLMNKMLYDVTYSYFYHNWEHKIWEKHFSFFAENFDMI